MPSPSRTTGRYWLALWALVMATAWLVLLPQAATLPGIADQLERLNRAGVDPGALFYSDHERAWGQPD